MVEIEANHFPFIFVRFAGRLTEDTAERFVEVIDAAIRRGVNEQQTVFFCGDTTDVAAIDARFRRVYTGWEKAIPDDDFAQIGTRVVVAPSALVRGAITAMGWFSARIKGIRAVETIDAAIAVLIEDASAAAAWTPHIEQQARRVLAPDTPA